MQKSFLQRNRWFDWLLLALLFGGLFYLFTQVDFFKDEPNRADFEGFATTIDGDSLKANGLNIRLAGIDAVEYDQTCVRDNKAYACGEFAHRYMKQLLARSQNQIKCILKGLDKYHRTLAVCYSKNADKSALSLNEKMIEAGWAVSYWNYQSLERDAKNHKRGLWAGEFIKPQEWRHKKK